MECEKCQLREATVHLKETSRRPLAGGGFYVERVEHHYCRDCAEEFKLGQVHGHSDSVTERVRVVSVSPLRTVLRVIRTEGQPTPEVWNVLTERLGKPFWPAGSEIEVVFTPAELAWLKGEKDKL